MTSILYKLVTGKDQAHGPDVSHWDGGFDPSKAAQRIDFAFMKLTEGSMFVDPLIDEIWQGVAQVAVRGAYHYQRSGMSWLLQADNFLTHASKYDFQVYIVDLEDINNKYDDTFFADTRRIIDYWREKAPTKKILLYTNWDTYKQLYYAITRLYPDGAAWLDALDFWYAWPSSVLPVPILPPQRKTWTFWQWDWAGKKEDWGTLAATDLNVFNGGIEQLKEWAGVTSQPPVETDPPVPPLPTPMFDPETEPDVYVGTALKNGIVIRTAPIVRDDTKTIARVNMGETFSGYIWVGDEYLWIKVSNTPRTDLVDKWLAVRKLDNSDILIRLNNVVVTSPPPVEQTEPGVSTIQYARLKHDRQLAMYNYRGRFDKTFPEPVPFYVATKANAGKDDIKLSATWENFLKGINSADGYKHIRVGTAGWFNGNKSADTLSFGGNVIQVEMQGNWAKIRAFNVNDNPPLASDVNFETTPYLIQKLVAVRKDGSITNPANGKDAFLFVIKRKGDLFVQLERIELFPALPLDVTAKSPLQIFSSANEKSATVGSLATGDKVRIYTYAPRGCSVWGKTAQGWIYLLRNVVPGKSEYFTSWTMATEPPIAPKAVG